MKNIRLAYRPIDATLGSKTWLLLQVFNILIDTNIDELALDHDDPLTRTGSTRDLLSASRLWRKLSPDTQRRESPAAILAFAASSSRIIRVFLGAYTRIRPI